MVPWVADPTRVAVLTLSAEWLSRMGPTSPVRIGGISLFCNQCGGRLADGSVFCNLCGAKQGVVAPAPTAPGVPPAPVAPGYPGGPAPMGQAYNPNVAVQPTVAPPMPQSLKCSSCGGPMKPSGGLALVVCEYCGAVTTMGAGGAAEIIQ